MENRPLNEPCVIARSLLSSRKANARRKRPTDFRLHCRWAILFMACGLFVLPAGPEPAEKPEIISLAKTPGVAAKLQSPGLDPLFEWEGRIYVLTGPREIRKLASEQISFRLESSKFPALTARPLHLLDGINGAYHSYSELEAELQDLERSYPQLARLFVIGVSLENRNIYALKISDNVSRDEKEAEVLFLGCHHAREWISVEVPLLLARFLLERYAADPAARRSVDNGEIWIVPLVNPDGLEYSMKFFRYWRKNRRFNPDGSFGVDLNRNYGYGWGYDDQGSSPEPASELYRGPVPFSEPETRAVRDLFFQRDFQALISYHSYSQLILYPWGFTAAPTDKDPLFESMASSMADRMQAVNGRIYGYGRAGDSLYLTNGDTTDWAFGITGIPAFTIELPPVDELGGGFFNPEQDIDPIFRENLPAALELIEWAILKFAAAAPGDPLREHRTSNSARRDKRPGILRPGRD